MTSSALCAILNTLPPGKLLKKIETIEDFYDVRFYRPDELYDGDDEKINLIPMIFAYKE